ncbi:MAG TPA: putative Fe-S cluster assembly protein SufT [Terriglobales bacterium]
MYAMTATTRDCEAIEIPSGVRRLLPAGTTFRVSQFSGSSYTIVTDLGYMCRVEAKDADALDLTPPAEEEKRAIEPFHEKMVWEQLKTVYDPEIPVNIVELGLIYSCKITTLEDGGKKIDVQMSLTAPGCGMANVLKADVETKLGRLPEVKEVNVEVVFDPPWHAGLMSEAAKLQLGFDLDYGNAPITHVR